MFLAKTGVCIENFLGIDGFDIYWYGIIIAFGFLLAFVLCSFFAKKRKYPSELTTDMLIIAIIGALIGARAYYVIFEWNDYFVSGDIIETCRRILNIRNGGLAIYGGIIGAIIGLFIYSRRKKYKLVELTDLCAAPLALGQALGRWGNFFNQEAHGTLVENKALQFFPYAVYLETPKGSDPAGWYQATFFYESVWCFIVCAVLVFIFLKKKKYHGHVTLWYFALYGLERGIVEWLRTDQLRIGTVPVSAVLSICLCIASVTMLIVLCTKKYTTQIEYVAQSKPEENIGESDGTQENTEENIGEPDGTQEDNKK